jgi:CheY-like chemotaxis protein
MPARAMMLADNAREGLRWRLQQPPVAPVVAPTVSVSGGAESEGGVVTRVLVVDDDADVRTVARVMLENAGIVVVEADGGTAGIRAFRDAGADLVLCDLFMPGLDGLEVIRALCREFPDMKVIAMSAGGFGGTVDLLAVARHLGAAGVLHKPFTQEALVEAVERVLRPLPGRD